MPALASSAFASRRERPGTISGVIALLAGRKKTLQVKSAKTSRLTGQTLCVAR
jgi:hypothetical protein